MPATMVERREDMSPTGRLRLFRQDDGDVIVAIVPDKNGQDYKLFKQCSVEFCSVGAGGGRSRHTLEALRALFVAMERDNVESPIRERGDV